MSNKNGVSSFDGGPSSAVGNVACLQGPGKVDAVLKVLSGVGDVTAGDVKDIVGKWSDAYLAYLEKSAGPVGFSDDLDVMLDKHGPGSVIAKSSYSLESGDEHEGFVGGGMITARDQGYCYLLAIGPRFRGHVAAILGPSPRLASLARLPVGYFASFTELDRLQVTGLSGIYHLSSGLSGSAFESFTHLVARLIVHIPLNELAVNSLGFYLSDVLVRSELDSFLVPGLDMRAVLGYDVDLQRQLDTRVYELDSVYDRRLLVGAFLYSDTPDDASHREMDWVSGRSSSGAYVLTAGVQLPVTDFAMRDGETVHLDHDVVALRGVFVIQGWTVDAAQVPVGLNVYGSVECMKSGVLVSIPAGYGFERSAANTLTMAAVYQTVGLEVYWPLTVHSVPRWEPVGERLGDGSLVAERALAKATPFQLLDFADSGATLVEPTRRVKLKLGCFTAVGRSAVMHRGSTNVSTLGFVASTHHDGGVVKILGIHDSYEWDCHYDSD